MHALGSSIEALQFQMAWMSKRDSRHRQQAKARRYNEVADVFRTGMDQTEGRKLMTRLMDLNRVRTVMEEAVSVSVQEVQLPGIAGAALRNVAVSSRQLQEVVAQLEQHGQGEIRLSAEVELYLRISNTDVLSAIEGTAFRVRLNADRDDLQAVAISEEDYGMAWERGIEPIKPAALRSMRRDVWNMDETLAEDSYTFQTAMVLLASELVGPYVNRISTFLNYPLALVQVVGARLQEAKIWEGDEVSCESWFDPNKGATAFLLDLLVAEGKLIRRWSEEKKEYAYHEPEIRAVSHFAV